MRQLTAKSFSKVGVSERRDPDGASSFDSSDLGMHTQNLRMNSSYVANNSAYSMEGLVLMFW